MEFTRSIPSPDIPPVHSAPSVGSSKQGMDSWHPAHSAAPTWPGQGKSTAYNQPAVGQQASFSRQVPSTSSPANLQLSPASTTAIPSSAGNQCVRAVGPVTTVNFFLRFHGSQKNPSQGWAPAAPGSFIPRFPYRKEVLLSSSPFSQDLVCQICNDLMNEPSMLACRHIFCKLCINRLQPPQAGHGQHNQSFCPIPMCRKPIYVTPAPSIAISARLAEISVRCINGMSYCIADKRFTPLSLDTESTDPLAGDDHCRHILTFDTIDNHFQDCKYTIKQCKHNAHGCTLLVLKRDLQAHEETCRWGMTTCTYCQQAMKHDRRQQHQDEECQKFPVPCPNAKLGCKSHIGRSDIGAHSQACPFGIPEVKESLERMVHECDLLKSDIAHMCHMSAALRQQIAAFQKPPV